MIRNTSNVSPRSWGEGCLTFELLADPALAVFHERMPPGTAEIRHYHARARQFFFVLAGELTITVDGTDHRLGVHDGLEIPPGTVHHVRNLSGGATEFLAIGHPSTSGDRHTA